MRVLTVYQQSFAWALSNVVTQAIKDFVSFEHCLKTQNNVNVLYFVKIVNQVKINFKTDIQNNLPSHLLPLHGGLHKQENVSSFLSTKQEPPLRQPVMRQPCRYMIHQ